MASEPSVVYPREVPILPGMPSDWRAEEKEFGPGSRTPGKVYRRYFSLDGRHRNVATAKQAIALDCYDKGLDFEKVLEEFQQIQKERKRTGAVERRAQTETQKKLSAQREATIKRFRHRFGPLSGPMVFQFPGWVARWHYHSKCEQVMVEYIDARGGSWKLLKDLEAAFQNKLDKGEGNYIPPLIEKAKKMADPVKFSEGAKRAKETDGAYEMSAEGTSRVIRQERQTMNVAALLNRTGTACRWNDEEGFGFIKPDNGESEIFVHRSALGASPDLRLEEGDQVEFQDIFVDCKGQRNAKNVVVLGRGRGGGSRGGCGGRDDSTDLRPRYGSPPQRGRGRDDSCDRGRDESRNRSRSR